jgi:hypothetical protein
MTMRILSFTMMAGVAAVLWVMPSEGTHGQGTLGNRFSHADTDVFGTSAAEQQSLLRADKIIFDAVAGL